MDLSAAQKTLFRTYSQRLASQQILSLGMMEGLAEGLSTPMVSSHVSITSP